jgi:hypothetical protein
MHHIKEWNMDCGMFENIALRKKYVEVNGRM